MFSLHLIGGGPGAITQMRRHLRSAVAAVGVKQPLVAYVGAASGDNAAFRRMLTLAFVGTGARVEPARLVSQKAKTSAARQLLEDCDLVFMSGGDVEEGMKVLRERDVADLLRRLASDGKPMAGISAGSIMLGRHWVRFPGDDDAKAEPFECLGIAPVHMDAHSEDDGWSELRTLVRLLGERSITPALGYGVPSKGCLRLGRNGASPTALGAPVARFAFRRGKTVEESPLPETKPARA